MEFTLEKKTIQYSRGKYFNNLIYIVIDLPLNSQINFKTIAAKIVINGTVVETVGGASTLNVLKKIAAFSKEINSTKKTYSKNIIFVNDLAIFYEIFKRFFYFNHIIGNEVGGIYNFETNDFEFRNLKMVMGYSSTPENLNEIKEFFESRLKDLRLFQINYSHVYGDIKIFKKNFPEAFNSINSLVQECFSSDEDYYNFQMSKCENCAVLYSSKSREGKLLSNVYSFDRKSFYPSLFVSIKQPIERPQLIKDADESLILESLKEGYAIDAIVSCKEMPHKVFSYLPDFPNIIKRENDYLFLINEIDLIFLKKFYSNFKIDSVEKLWVAAKGYLPDSYRKSLVEMFFKKETLEDGSLDRQNYKAGLNAQIGKAAQRVFYTNDLTTSNGKVEKKDSSRKYDFNFAKKAYRNRIGVPQWASRIYSYARFSIFTTCSKIIKLGGLIIYIDTDSIKFTIEKEKESYAFKIFEEESKAIRNKIDSFNLGGSSNLGEWSYEYCAEYFRTFGLKSYLFSSEGETTFKFAGVKKSILKEQLGSYSIKDLTLSKIKVKNALKIKKKIGGSIVIELTDWSLREFKNEHEFGFITLKPTR